MSNGTDRGGRTPALLFTLVVVATLLLAPAAKATDKCGEVGGETWVPPDSPYVVTCRVTVAEGSTLTVEPGVEVRFQAGTGMTVDGTLNVNGTVSDNVTFTSDQISPAAGDWTSVLFNFNATGDIRYTLLEYSGYGINVGHDATVTLIGVTTSQNQRGMTVQGTGNPTVYATGCTITDNTSVGVEVDLDQPNQFSTPVTIVNSELHGNGVSSGGLEINTGATDDFDTYLPYLVMARGNYWGTEDAATIADNIEDSSDNFYYLPSVDFCGFLDDGGVPVRDVHCPDLVVDPAETEFLIETDKPYLLTSSMHMHGDLQVGPGVEVRVVPNSNLNRGSSVAVWGDAFFLSTSGSPALFTSDAATPSPEDWFGLEVWASGTIQNAIFNYAYAGVRIQDGDVIVDNVTARFNQNGLEFAQVHTNTTPDITVTNSTFTDNEEHGVLVLYNTSFPGAIPSLSITNSSIHDNGTYGFFVDADFPEPWEMSLVAHNNWWGTTITDNIRNAIYDNEDDPNRPKVDWCGHLSSEGGPPVYDMHCPDLTICHGEDVTLNQVDKPYLLTQDLYVCDDGILRVEDGVEIRAADYAPQPSVYVYGQLLTTGVDGNPVSFTSNASPPQANDWDGIFCMGSSTCDLQHTDIRYALGAVETRGSSTVTLYEVEVRDNGHGLFISGTGPVTATYSTFADNTNNGIEVRGSPDPAPVINYSSIYGNGGYQYYAVTFDDPDNTRLDATQNWWGTTNGAAIAAGIYDHSDVSTSPTVDWCGYQETEGGPGRDVNCPQAYNICGGTSEWLLNDKPYLVTSDIYVCPTGLLRIHDGVEVLFADTGTPLELLVEGTLETLGAELNPVTLHSDAASPAAGDWTGVKLEDSGHATLNHTTIADGDYGIHVGDSATADLDGATIRDNTTGLYLYGTGPPSATAIHSSFIQNTTYGVHVRGRYPYTDPDPSVTINSSSIHSNGGSYDFYSVNFVNAATTVLDARENWWGTTDTTAIGSRILDQRRNGSAPRVDWCRYLDDTGTPLVDAHCPDLVVCDETEEWLLTDKPYQVTTDFWVCPTGTLQVGPGVDVRTVKTTPKPDFLVEGTFDVNGTVGSPVRFGSDAPSPAAGDWDGVELRGSSVSDIHNAEFRDGTYGLDVGNGATVDLDGVTTSFNNTGLYVYGIGPPTVTAVNSSFVDNTTYGVDVRGRYPYTDPNPSVTISSSSIHSNGGSYDFYSVNFVNAATTVLDARENYWGTTDTTAIGSRILDQRRNGSAPRIDWCRYLSSEGGVPELDAYCPDLVVCDETEEWLLTDKPYHVTTDLWVCPTGTLQVGPGVDVRTVKTTYKPDFLIEGVFDINGTVGSPAIFGSDAASPAAGDWDGVELRGSSVSDIHNAEFRDGTYGLDVGEAAWATLHGVTTRLNQTGLYLYGSGPPTVHAANSSFVENTGYGVDVRGQYPYSYPNPSLTVTRSSIHSNGGTYDFYSVNFVNPDTTSLWATDNWWNTTDTTQIASRIHDRDDNGSAPRVRFQAFGEECDYALGWDRDGDDHADFLDNCPEFSNASQTDADLDGMGDSCDPEPGIAPSSACDGFDDVSDGWLDADGDGWGDPCDFHPLRDDSYPGATEICDARDNDGDAQFSAGEMVDADLDLGILCGDCDDSEPNAHVCLCEDCGSGIDDDCDLLADGADPDCVPFDACVVLEAGAEPYLTMHNGVCGGATLSDPHDFIRGRVDALTFVSGSVDLGAVTCVAAAHAWDRATDQSLNPNPKCDPMPVLFYLAKYDTDGDYGQSSTGEWRDIMTPDPACVP